MEPSNRKTILSHSDLQFVLGGPPKTSTFWLAECLRSHPDIFITSETNFLSHHTHKTYEFWKNYFSRLKNESIVGEYANGYFAHSTVPEKLAQANPHIKIIFSIRDPIAQVISFYQHDLQYGTLGRHVKLRFAINRDIFYTRYIDSICYSKHLRTWLKYFPANQIYLFSNSPDPTLRQKRLNDLYLFLRGSSHSPNCIDKRLNTRQNPLFPTWFRNSRMSQNVLVRLLALMINPINLGLGKLFVSSSISIEDREALLKAFQLTEERKKLEELISKELFRGVVDFESWSI